MITRSEDRLALRELIDSYAVALDARDVAAFVELFTPDARVTIIEAGAGHEYPVRRGHAEISVAVPRMAQRYVRTFHLVGQQVVRFDGPRTASGRVYCIANHVDVDGANRVVHLTYDDEYELVAQRWLFTARTLNYEWEEVRPTSGDRRPDA